MNRPHLASLLDDFDAHGSETAVVEHRGIRSYRTSYGALRTLAGRFAAELQRRGVGPGERVLIVAENSAAWIAVFFGCLIRGVLAVPLDTAGSPEFMHRVLANVQPRLIVADATRLRSLALGRPDVGVPTLDLDDLAQQLPAEPNFRVDPAVEPDLPFQIVFTSGTTSEPKGIVHTHRNVLASLAPIETEMAKYRRYERPVHPLRFLHALPLSHVFGQFMGLWIPGVLAAELHLSDAVDSGRVLALIRREHISVLVAVPRVLSLLRAFLLGEQPQLAAELDSAASLPVLRRWWRFRAVHRRFGWKFWAVISGGAALPLELETFWNRLGFALIQGYGMTETAALVTLNHPFHVGQGTIGKALPGREIRLSDTGELHVRGDMVARSTWQGGQLQSRESDWLATGDLVAQNAAGEFQFLGRKGDVIVTSSGLNIHPADLETAMLQQPGVQACAVVPCDTANGPEPVCVVLFQGSDADLEKATRSANQALAGFQQMRRVLRWTELAFPYTSTGKLLRRSIREWAALSLLHDGISAPAPSGRGDLLLNAIASVTNQAVPSTERQSELRLAEDLHLDSLGRVQLASAIEQRTGVLLSDAVMASLHTIDDLRRSVAASLAFTGSELAANEAAVRAVPLEQRNSPLAAGAAASTAARADVQSPILAGATYPRWPWRAPVRWFRMLFVEAVVRPLVRVLLAPKIRIEAPPPPGPLLLIANHVTMLDAALVLYALPLPLRRNLAVMMSGEWLAGYRSGERGGIAGPLTYWLLTALFNVFPLPQLQGFRQSFAHAGEALDRGMSVLIFPEGARSKTGNMAPFRSGIGLLASQATAPVLPVGLVGLHRIRARGARWFRSGALEIRIGPAVPWTADETPEQRTANLEAHLRALLGSETR